jgi:hypothetical protein
MTHLSRRGFAVAAAATLAGCLGDSSDADPPESTELIEDATAEDYGEALTDQGINADSLKEFGGDWSLLFVHEGSPTEELDTIALTFVPYRGIAEIGLSVTALHPGGDRHGVGHVQRQWADDYAAGEISEATYLDRVQDGYEQIGQEVI